MRTHLLLSTLACLLAVACDDDTGGGGVVDFGPLDGGLFIDAKPPEAGPGDAAGGAGGEGAAGGEGGEGGGQGGAGGDLDATVGDQGADLGPDAVVTVDYDLPDAAPTACSMPPDAPPQVPIDLSARCRANRNAPLRIRDLRDSRCDDYERLPTSQPGRNVVLPEAIVTGLFGSNFSVSDPEGGAWAGLYVFNRGGADVGRLEVGSRVRLTGQVIEFFTLTELVIANDGIELLGQGPAPEPIYVADAARLATGGDLAEPLESVLVEVRSLRVADTAPDCPLDFGMFVLSGGLRIDDENDFDYVAARGDHVLRAAGVLHYSFNHTKLFVRGRDDIEAVACGGVPDKCEAVECSVASDAPESGRLIITEIQNDPTGEDALREFVELYNPGPGNLDLTDWTVQDCAGNEARLRGQVAARGYHVIARSRDEAVNGGVRAQGDMGELFLPNTAGSVLVFDHNGNLVDQVRYDVVAPWPDRAPGRSLELTEPAADNRDGSAWVEADDRYGEGGFGSPGRGWRP